MDKNDILQSIQEARKNAKKRKFVQTVDFILNFKGLDLKKETDRINTYVALPYERGKKIRVTALVGPELSTKAKAVCDNIVTSDTFKTIEKKAVKKLASQSDFFIAQSNIMPQVAAAFGKILGPKGLMPNPKAGCVVGPTQELKPVIEKLKKTIHLQTKNDPVVRVPLGLESMKDEELVENALLIYNTIVGLLPQEKNNLKSMMIKWTMGKPSVLRLKEVVEVKQ
ncbi:MAG: hypothetical protein AABX72_04835 [Nanoarchaeota archaeon]